MANMDATPTWQWNAQMSWVRNNFQLSDVHPPRDRSSDSVASSSDSLPVLRTDSDTDTEMRTDSDTLPGQQPTARAWYACLEQGAA